MSFLIDSYVKSQLTEVRSRVPSRFLCYSPHHHLPLSVSHFLARGHTLLARFLPTRACPARRTTGMDLPKATDDDQSSHPTYPTRHRTTPPHRGTITTNKNRNPSFTIPRANTHIGFCFCPPHLPKIVDPCLGTFFSTHPRRE